MASGDDSPGPEQPVDPEHLLAAAEAAHLASRRDPAPEPRSASGPETGPAPRPLRRRRGRLGPGGRPAGRGRSAGTSRAGRLVRDRGWSRRAPLPVAAAVATGWAAVLSFAPLAALATLLVAAEAGFTGLAGPVRVAAAGWLLGHGVPVGSPEGAIGIAPLAVAVLAAWRLVRAGVHVTRAMGARHRGSAGQAVLAAASVAVGYAGVGALAALGVGDAEWGVSLPRAVATVGGFGLLAAGAGALSATGVLRRWTARLPAPVPAGARAGLAAAAGILAAGGVLAGAALALRWRAASEVLAGYDTDVAGQAGLTVLCLAYAPNLAVWAAAYLLGPGFAVGAGTVVRSSEVTVPEPLPPLPVLAGVPDGPLPTLGAVLLVVPVLAGALAGETLARRMPPRVVAGRAVVGWGRLVCGSVVCAVVAGGLLGLAAAASGGPLAGGALARLGPDPALVAGFAAAAVLAGGLLGVAVAAVGSRRRHSHPG